MELVLMRHGKAEERGSRERDEERQLTEKGREKTIAAARGLAQVIRSGSPVTIWTSHLTRALQTAELVAAEVRGAEVAVKEAIASGDLDALHEDFKEFDREGTLIIIGHEPYLSHWGSRIAGVILPLKPSAAMAITLSSAVPPEGNILWFAHGQALRRLAPAEPRPRRTRAKKKA